MIANSSSPFAFHIVLIYFILPCSVPVDPVALNIPDYFQIVKRPMDLGTIKARLTSNFYTSAKDVLEDVRLVWANALMYNKPGSDICVMVNELSTIFEKDVATYDLDLPAEEDVKEEKETNKTAKTAAEMGRRKSHDGSGEKSRESLVAKAPPPSLDKAKASHRSTDSLKDGSKNHTSSLVEDEKAVGDERQKSSRSETPKSSKPKIPAPSPLSSPPSPSPLPSKSEAKRKVPRKSDSHRRSSSSSRSAFMRSSSPTMESDFSVLLQSEMQDIRSDIGDLQRHVQKVRSAFCVRDRISLFSLSFSRWNLRKSHFDVSSIPSSTRTLPRNLTKSSR